MRLPLLVSNKLTHLRFFAIAALVAFVGDARGQGTQASANGSSESSSDPTAQVTPEQLQFFETKIRPVLVESCYRCHSNEGQGFRGGLSVANREGLLAGGESGAAIVPGNLEESLLWNAINYRDFRKIGRAHV